MVKKRDETSPSSTISSKKLLKELVHKKIAYYLSKAYLEDTDLYKVFKEFFAELLELKYEFTCGELLNELNKVFLDKSTRAKTTNFIKKIRLIEFKQNTYTNEDIRKLFKEFDDLVNLLISKTVDDSKKGIFSFLFHKRKEDEHPFLQKIDDGSNQRTAVLSSTTPKDNTITSTSTQTTRPVSDALSDIVSKELPAENSESDYLQKDSPDASFDKIDYDKEDTDLASDPEITKSAKYTMEVNEDFTKEPIRKSESNTKKKAKKEEAKKKDSEDINSLLLKAKKIKSKRKLEELYAKALSAYNSLDNKTKGKYYSKLNKLYKKIN